MHQCSMPASGEISNFIAHSPNTGGAVGTGHGTLDRTLGHRNWWNLGWNLYSRFFIIHVCCVYRMCDMYLPGVPQLCTTF